MLRQMVRAGRLDRSFYTSLLYDGYATGNAVVVTAIVGVLPVVSTLSVVVLALAALGSILRAVLVAVAVWASGVYLFRRNGQLGVTFRLVGFAHIAFIPMAAAPWVDVVPRLLLTIATAIWFFFALRLVADAQFDVSHPESSFVATAGLLGWYIGMILF